MVPLLTDTFDLLVGRRTSGFLVSLSTDITIRSADSGAAQIDVQATSFHLRADLKSQQFRVEYGLPARLGPVTGKNNARFYLTIVPIGLTSVDTSGCNFSLASDGDFVAEPTAHTDLYYVKQTLGDYQWLTMKSLFEDQFRQLDSSAHLAIPGKYAVYLSPCRLPELIWDDRFSMLIDPVRSSCYVILNPQTNSADPFALKLAAVWKNFGYTPAFIAEGLAGFQSSHIVQMKQLLRQKQALMPEALLTTSAYFAADPVLADRTASSFAAFLIQAYGLDRYLVWFRTADDLNQQLTLESSFGAPLGRLTAEWKRWVDTASFSSSTYGRWISDAETAGDFTHASELAELVLPALPRRVDSVALIAEIARFQFFDGNYQKAADWQAVRQRLDSAAADISNAAYQMMLGNYATAKSLLLDMLKSDSASSVILFNLGVLANAESKPTEAERWWRKSSSQGSGSGRLESKVMLAHQIVQQGKTEELREAQAAFSEAISTYSSLVGQHMISPHGMLWSGIAYAGQQNTSDAYQALSIADFIEVRPFYRGMIALWLGRVHDLRGERDLAKSQYQRVIESSSAAYHKFEAKSHLITPFRIP